MNRACALLIVSLLMLGARPSWGAPPNPTDSDANGNTAGVSFALLNVTTGNGNTGFGRGALFQTTTGIANTACGDRALSTNTTGSHNTGTGFGALLFNTGSANTASGSFALLNNTSGGSNAASGFGALFTNTTGDLNTASGTGALMSNETGEKNTAVGYAALQQSTGNQNVAIGHRAGATLESGNQNIYIGHPGASSESRTLRVGNTQTRAYVAGVASSAVNGAAVLVAPNGRLGVQLSSARYKRDIETMGARSAGVLRLRPVTFFYTGDAGDADGVRQYGLVAEEVAAVYPELVTHTEQGDVQAVRYQEIIPLLLDQLQRQQRELADLRAAIAELGASGRGTEGTPVQK